jgi:predicted lipoprotein with Yx(FWY)xxD motif
MIRNRSITTRRAGAALLAVAGLAFAGCGGGSSKAGASATTSATNVNAQPAAVGVANNKLGSIVVDADGRTVYLFEKDSGTTSACNGACASAWPPVTANGTPTVAGGATAALVGTITRSDGTSQVIYNGHPLYRYVGDQKAGDTNGQGLNAFGGGWFAVSPAGDQVAASTSSSGNGY